MKNDLISALHAARHGSRALDARVLQSREPDAKIETHYESYWVPECDKRGVGGFETPYFTIGVDDALTLLPKGWMLEHLGDDAAGKIGAMEAFGATAEITNGEIEIQGQGATRAIAVVIACLRADEALRGPLH